MCVLVEAGEKQPFSGNPETENITVIEAVGISTRIYHRWLFLREKSIFMDGIEERCLQVGLQQCLQMVGPMPYSVAPGLRLFRNTYGRISIGGS